MAHPCQRLRNYTTWRLVLQGEIQATFATVVKSHTFYVDQDNVIHLMIEARPDKWHENDCPICGRHCPCFDHPARAPKMWRGLDFAGIVVEIQSETHRIKCPEHGVITAAVPWAYSRSSFTKDFDLTVAWLAEYIPRKAVAEYMRIDWQTVGNCISRSSHDLEPERAKRLDNLVHIGIDETSYCKGHKYITVVLNHDTNTVVWIGKDHGKSVLEKFYQSLTKEQLASIKVVTGDGARWITDCVNEFTPNCDRCVDPFYVVEWAMDALNKVRLERWRAASAKAKKLAQSFTPRVGRPKLDDKDAVKLKEACEKAAHIKGSAYALGKAPENLTANQQVRLDIIKANDPKLSLAYNLKESLRTLLKETNMAEAEAELTHWLWWASQSKIEAFCELSKKIRRHKEHILNTIRFGLSNARIEATSNKIKLLIRKSYGFRKIQNMMDMIYLVCSNIRIPLPNRKLIVGKHA